MSFLWWGVGVFAFLYLVALLMVVRVLLQIDLQLPRRTRIDAEEIPAYLRPCFDELHSELEHLGFEHRGYLSCTAIGRTAGPPIHGSLLLHPATGAYAELDTQTMSECTPFGITFHSQLKSGRRLITLNGTSWGVIGEMPNTDLVDAWAATLALHWSAHQKEVEKRGGAVAVEVDAFLSSADAEERAMVEGLLGNGRAVPTRERGIARLGIWTALRAALPVRRGMARKLFLRRALLRNPAAGVLPDREQARSALAWMREHLAKISAPKRHAIVRAVCHNELHQPARLAPTFLLGAAYLATVALGIAVVARQLRAAGEDRAATCEIEEAEETGPSPSP